MALGNPAPLGLLAFGMTTAMLMYVDMGWAENELQELVSGYAIFYGGLFQVLAGIFELVKGSSFSFTVFGSYGAFWLGWGLVLLQNHSLASDYGEEDYTTGRTLVLVQWGVLTACFLSMALRKNICLIVVLSFLMMTFFLLAAATSTGNPAVQKAAGYIGFITAIAAWYTAVAELVNEEYGRHLLPGLKPRHAPERFQITKDTIVKKRTSYDAKTNTLLLQFRGLQIKTQRDVQAIQEGVVEAILSSKSPTYKVHVIVDYEDAVISEDVAADYWNMVAELEKNYYLSVRRFHVTSFGTRRGSFKSAMPHTTSRNAIASANSGIGVSNSMRSASGKVYDSTDSSLSEADNIA